MGEVYRPPSGSLLSFLQVFNGLIESMHQQTSEMVIMGDFNIKLLENKGSVLADFLSAMMMHDLLSTIMILTRVADQLIIDISDHVQCDLLIPNKQTKPPSPMISPFNFLKKNLAQLKGKLLQKPWDFVNGSTQLDVNFMILLSKLLLILVLEIQIECHQKIANAKTMDNK